jgi:hypothetical protein
MEAKKYRIDNQTKDRSLSSSVSVIDATLEPLKILRVLVEGIAANDNSGLWLKNVSGIPMVPRISPFDLVYLDKDQRVLEGVEVLPAADFPAFKKPAESALVLPFQSLASSETEQSDQLIFTEIEETSAVDGAQLQPTESGADAATASSEMEEKQPEPAELSPEVPNQPRELVEETESVVVSEIKEEAKPVELLSPDEGRISLACGDSSSEHQHEASVLDKEIASGGYEVDLSTEDLEGSESPEDPVVAVSVSAFSDPGVGTIKPQATQSSATEDSAPAEAPDYPFKTRFEIQDTDTKKKNDSTPTEKEWMVSRFLRWLYPSAYETDRRMGRRIPIPNLVAYNLSSGSPQALEVVDISSSGVFLVTNERWSPGSLVCLSLQREGPLEQGTERRIVVAADPVRWGSDGVGLSFVLPKGMDVHLWEGPEKGGLRQSEPEYVLREFRMAKALAFLGRISPRALDEAKRLLQEELSNVRSECAINVALKAEERLALETDGHRLLVHPDLMIRIVDGASWADNETMQDLWTGLLVASCSPDGNDNSNLVFINLLTQLATIQTRILIAVCEKAVTVGPANRGRAAEKIFSTAEEMAQMAGTHDLLKIHRSIAQLSEFGLLEKSVRASFISETEGATTTPTSLGLQMYARCLGHRGNS